MACEVPVISTNAGGLPELNAQGKSGYVCDVGDIDTMVKYAIHILDNKNLENFKDGALARAKEFDVNNILPEYEGYYQAVVEKYKKSLSESL